MSPSQTVSTRSRRAALRMGATGLVASLTLQGRPPVLAGADGALEANTALVHSLFDDAINGGDLTTAIALYAPGVRERGASEDTTVGWGGLPLPIAQFHAHFPDIVAIIDEVIAAGDAVAVRVSWRGPHPPAGTHLIGRTLHVFHVADGQIAAQWSAGWDWLS